MNNCVDSSPTLSSNVESSSDLYLSDINYSELKNSLSHRINNHSQGLSVLTNQIQAAIQLLQSFTQSLTYHHNNDNNNNGDEDNTSNPIDIFSNNKISAGLEFIELTKLHYLDLEATNEILSFVAQRIDDKQLPHRLDWQGSIEEDFAEQRQVKRNSKKQAEITAEITQIKKSLWRIANKDFPYPGEEDEDLIEMNDSDDNRIPVCPITQSSIEIAVKSLSCPHLYEQSAIQHYIQSHRNKDPIKCPVAGCRGIISSERIAVDEVTINRIRRIQRREQLAKQNRSHKKYNIHNDETDLTQNDNNNHK
jgi:SUMO ligase MMS21 Smc5/6 complex component